MAQVTASNIQVHTFLTPNGPVKNTAGAEILSCFLSCVFTGTYDNTAHAQITAAATAIQTGRRDGKTVTLLNSAFAAPTTESGTTLIGASAATVSGANINCNLTIGDMATEHGNAVLGPFDGALTFYVTYTAV